MSFTIAIVGRPNVGKSTLFNRLAGKKLAIVDDTPGVTRDRREGIATLGSLTFKVIDTAGLEEAAPETLYGRMRVQTETAMAAADAVIFVIDARAGVTPADRAFANVVRRAGRPTILVANKSEGRAGDAGGYEAFGLGLGDPVLVSAEHGEGTADLYDAIRKALPDHVAAQEDAQEFGEDEDADGEKPVHPIRVAVIGRPNVGKSTMINRLLGEERLLTGPEAGITRDTIAVPLTYNGRQFLIHDTAGMRRRARIDDKLEKMSVGDALESIRFAEVVVVLMDNAQAFEEQDLRLVDFAEREGRAVVIAFSKWDLETGGQGIITKLRAETDMMLPQVKGAPVVAVSGLTGFGLDRLMEEIVEAHHVWNKRITTNALNRWFEEATNNNPPPAVSGRRLKLNYITQTKARPPSFVIFCSRADAVPESYLRYLVNGMRETFGLPGTPIRIALREKKNPYAHKAKRK
jgi:GTP-binding protein